MSYSSSYSDSSDYSDDDYSYSEEDSQDFALQAPLQGGGIKRTASQAGLIDRDPLKKRRIAPTPMDIDDDIIMPEPMELDPMHDLTRSFQNLAIYRNK